MDKPKQRHRLRCSDVKEGDKVMARMFLGGQETHVPATIRSIRPGVGGVFVHILQVDVDDEEVENYGIDNPVEIREPYVMVDRVGGFLTIERTGGAAVPEYVLFTSNTVANKKIPVEFLSAKAADEFIRDYENMGGFKRFRADVFGDDRVRFIEQVGDSEIVKATSSRRLFNRLMSKFEEGTIPPRKGVDAIEDVVDGLLGEQEPPDDQPLVQRGMLLSQRAADIAQLFGKFHGDLLGQLPEGPSDLKGFLRKTELSLAEIEALIKDEGL